MNQHINLNKEKFNIDKTSKYIKIYDNPEITMNSKEINNLINLCKYEQLLLLESEKNNNFKMIFEEKQKNNDNKDDLKINVDDEKSKTKQLLTNCIIETLSICHESKIENKYEYQYRELLKFKLNIKNFASITQNQKKTFRNQKFF